MGIVLDADYPHDYLVLMLQALQDNPDIMGIVHDVGYPHDYLFMILHNL